MLIRGLLLLLFLFAPLQAFADSAEDAHLKAAFTAARSKQWDDAIAHAKAAHSPILVKYFTWGYLKDAQSDASFFAIVDFLDNNPDWPDRNVLERRAEVALLAGNPSQAQIDAWFKKHPPHTSLAKIKTAHDKEALNALVREAWVTEDYNQATETKLLEKYHGILRTEDHIRRVDRLLWEDKEDEARRLLKKLPYDYQRMFTARLSLMQDKSRALVDLANMPPKMRSDPGIIFERVRWRLRHDDKDGVREMLLAAPKDVPYPDKWWPIRDRQIREALNEGNVKLARILLANHGQKAGTISYREACWLSGWIALEFENNAESAYRTFSALYNDTESAGGKARVAYWTARAAEVLHKDSATWFARGAHYPTTFYGELSLWETNKNARMSLHSDSEPTHEEKERFEKQDIVQLVHALGRAHESDLAEHFILYLVNTSDSLDKVILAARLGREINRIDFGVRASKEALQNGILSIESAYPVIHVPGSSIGDKALLLALMRQESEFFCEAISTSGACGLMQLLPRTARELARKNHINYSNGRLFDPDYNMTVGSMYLREVLEKFGGSYVLTVAAYNAGPGRVGQWTELQPYPRGDVRAVVDWIEKIPFSETRHYVQHVLENAEVYRFMLADRKPVALEIAKDLSR